jgi:hypothetical protein
MYVTISADDTVSMRGHGGECAGLTIVALSLFAQPGEESLAVAMSIACSAAPAAVYRTSHAVRGIMLACVACSLSGRRGASRPCPRRGNGAGRAARTSVAIVIVFSKCVCGVD